jgi:hypothetical protein
VRLSYRLKIFIRADSRRERAGCADDGEAGGEKRIGTGTFVMFNALLMYGMFRKKMWNYKRLKQSGPHRASCNNLSVN